MENQQPAAGYLTVDATEADESSHAATESAVEITESAGEEPAEATEEASDSAANAKEKRARRKPLAGKWRGIAVGLAALVFVGSAAFAGAMLQPSLAVRTDYATKLKVERTAAQAVTTLWTYNPENMDGLANRAAAYLSGDFAAQYRRFVDAIVGPNKQAKVTNDTEVVGAAVESLDDPNAVVIVYTNTTSKSPLNKGIPSMKYFSYRLFMKRTDNRWLVTRMTTVTSLDLTPHP